MKMILGQKRMTQTFLALFAIIILGLWLQFSIHTSTTWMEFPRFLVAFVFFFLLPGSLMTRWLKMQMSPVEHFTLSLALGMVTTSTLYIVLAWAQLPFLLWLWAIVGLVSIATHRSALENIWRGMQTAKIHHLLLLLALIGGLLPLYFLNSYYGNLSWTSDGRVSYIVVKDILLHASIASELTHAFPPQVPFLAGVQLNYHIGMDIISAVLNRFADVAIVDMEVRFFPTLVIVFVMLSAYCLTRLLTGSGYAGVTAALLIVLGEDMSFIPGILQQSEEAWSNAYFHAPTIYSFYYFNPMAVALGLLLTGLFCFYRSMEEMNWGWSIAASLCIAGLIQTKIFVFVHFILALGITMAFYLLVFRRLLFFRQAVMFFLVSLPLVLCTVLINGSGGQFIWAWSSGVENYVIPAFRMAHWQLLVSYPALGLGAYLALTYGFRLLGCGELIKSLRGAQDRPFHFFLAILVVLGPLVSLTSKIIPRDDPGAYNNAIWFMITSKFVAVLFAVTALLRLSNSISSSWRPALIVLVATLSLPSTIQYVLKPPSVELGKLSLPEIETITFLNHEVKPGDVAISRIGGPLLLFTKLHLPYLPIFVTSFAKIENVDMRLHDMEDFWQAWKLGEAREDLLLKYHANWIITSQSVGTLGDVPVIDMAKLRLQRIFINSDYIVFQVLPQQI
jgi:hypothetical protein